MAAAMLWTTACGEPDAGAPGRAVPVLSHRALDVVELTAEVLNRGDSLGLPMRIAVVGDYLVVLETHADPAFHLYRLPAGELVGSFGGFGEGPGEFISPRSLDPLAAECCGFWIYDLGTVRFTYANIDSLLARPSSLGDSSVTFLADRVVVEPRWLNRDDIVATGLFEGGRLAVFDGRGNGTGWIGPLPASDPETPVPIAQHAYQSSLLVHPDEHAIAVATRHGGLLEIFEADGQGAVRAATPFPFVPTYEMGQGAGEPAMMLVEDTRLGYVDLAATRTAIYGLFSGRTIGGYRSEAASATFVHQFDWNGTFAGAFRLDVPVLAIAVDARTGILYGLRHNPTPAILAFPPVH